MTPTGALRHAHSHPPRDGIDANAVSRIGRRRARQHRRKDGSDKRAFATHAEARDAAYDEMEATYVKTGKTVTLHAYECPYCEGWHIGRKMRRPLDRWDRVPMRYDEGLLTELGERVVGCLRSENHGLARTRERTLANVTGAVAKRRDVLGAAPTPTAATDNEEHQ